MLTRIGKFLNSTLKKAYFQLKYSWGKPQNSKSYIWTIDFKLNIIQYLLGGRKVVAHNTIIYYKKVPKVYSFVGNILNVLY